ncbi:hypothetical protein KP509_18G070300 [Ceratopteris richardii]|uniref:Uncharacterized protein n=1 Tax=Ceratopteris richardii TaxID=49495 RepID=A0A8T2SVC1_CERRI|nr:hypothetical protein KP509_18G070300 [Ceratopteris richardii]
MLGIVSRLEACSLCIFSCVFLLTENRDDKSW